MINHAFIFPGQGSQAIGMLAELAEEWPIVQQTFDEASDILGYDLWQLAQTGPKDMLNQTERSQPVLLAAGVSVWRIWRAEGGVLPICMAGHSFGEYTALTCAESLDYRDAVALAQARGQFMQAAAADVQGAVVAILGLDADTMQMLCVEEATNGAIVAAANFNDPSQIVITGHSHAVQRVVDKAMSVGAKKAMPLAVNVPVHCDLMRPAAEKLAEKLNAITLHKPIVPVIHNVDISTREEMSAIRHILTEQLYSPVRWVETIHKMAESGVVSLMEGGGKVLSKLNKRINRELSSYPITDATTLRQALEATA